MKYDVVIIGGGLAGLSAAEKLSSAGKKCLVVQAGISTEACLGSASENSPRTQRVSGFTLLRGDKVLRGEFSGCRLLRVFTANLGCTALEADSFILATGKFFSRGLISTMEGIFEPVFGCDVEYDSDRSAWVREDFFCEQPFERFGVVSDDSGRVSVNGVFIDNLYAAGSILAGGTELKETVDRVCRNII